MIHKIEGAESDLEECNSISPKNQGRDTEN